MVRNVEFHIFTIYIILNLQREDNFHIKDQSHHVWSYIWEVPLWYNIDYGLCVHYGTGTVTHKAIVRDVLDKKSGAVILFEGIVVVVIVIVVVIIIVIVGIQSIPLMSLVIKYVLINLQPLLLVPAVLVGKEVQNTTRYDKE